MEAKQDMYSDGSLIDEVMQLMLQAEKHSGGDPGVQVSIFVLVALRSNVALSRLMAEVLCSSTVVCLMHVRVGKIEQTCPLA